MLATIVRPLHHLLGLLAFAFPFFYFQPSHAQTNKSAPIEIGFTASGGGQGRADMPAVSLAYLRRAAGKNGTRVIPLQQYPYRDEACNDNSTFRTARNPIALEPAL